MERPVSFGGGNHATERLAIVRIAHRGSVQDAHSAGGAGIGGGDRGFDAELVRRAGFALADALDLGAWKE